MAGKPSNAKKAPEVKAPEPKVKVPTVPTENAKLRRLAHKAKVRARGTSGGPSITPPEINWEWFQETMTYRWPSGRQLRTMDAWDRQRRNRTAPSDAEIAKDKAEVRVKLPTQRKQKAGVR